MQDLAAAIIEHRVCLVVIDSIAALMRAQPGQLHLQQRQQLLGLGLHLCVLISVSHEQHPVCSGKEDDCPQDLVQALAAVHGTKGRLLGLWLQQLEQAPQAGTAQHHRASAHAGMPLGLSCCPGDRPPGQCAEAGSGRLQDSHRGDKPSHGQHGQHTPPGAGLSWGRDRCGCAGHALGPRSQCAAGA